MTGPHSYVLVVGDAGGFMSLWSNWGLPPILEPKELSLIAILYFPDPTIPEGLGKIILIL